MSAEPSGSQPTSQDGSTSSHQRWMVLLLLCLMYFITYLDRVAHFETLSMQQHFQRRSAH